MTDGDDKVGDENDDGSVSMSTYSPMPIQIQAKPKNPCCSRMCSIV
jgi:hypothetical protein